MTFISTKYITPFLTFIISVGFLLTHANIAYAQTSIDSPANGSTQTATQYALFELDIDVSGGLSPYQFTATGLPSGFQLIVNEDRTAAIIEGATSDTATATVNVEVTDSLEGGATTSDVTFDIDITPISTTTTIIIDVQDTFLLPEGTVNEQYTLLPFSTTDDSIEDVQYQWSTSGNLPNGMLIDPATGNLQGRPTESGEFYFTVEVTDIDSDPPNKADGARDYKLVINGSSGSGDLEISSPTSSQLPSGILGEPYSTDIDASGGTEPYTFSQSGLPGGLNIDAGTGIISGSPNSIGTFNVTITVTDDNDDTADRDYTLRITETGEAGYDSDPSPGSTLDFGNVNIGASYTLELIVSETGSTDLEVDEPSAGAIQGSDPDMFSITDNDPPFTIEDGDDDVVVKITCRPEDSTDYNATLRFETNDVDNEIVVYSLFCTGVIDGGNEDDDSDTGDTDGDVVVDDSTPTPSIPTQTPLPPTYSNVIEVEGLSLRTGPFIGASRKGVLRPDTNYRVTAKSNAEGVYMWYYIITDDGLEGWASGRYLAVYGDDVPFAGSVLDNVWNERDRGVIVEAYDNIHFRPGPSDRTQPYPDLIPWAGRMTVYARTTSGRGDEWYAVEYNGVRGWVYADVVKVVEGLMEAIPKY